jgi:acyl dehydratase
VSGGAGTGLNAALAGKDLGVGRYEVTAEAIRAFARATEDDNPHYASGARSIAGPVWPVVPAFESFMAAARDPELGADLRRLLHLSEEHLLVRPIRPGDVLTVRAVLEGVALHAAGETFTVAVRELDRDDELVAEVRGTMLIRGRGTGERPVQETPSGDVVHTEAVTIAEDQMRRYADASGDHNPIHLDAAAARRSGLRRPILHGMCTMAIAVKAAVNGPARGDPGRVRRARVDFARPVVPGETLTTRVRRTALEAVYALEVVNESGAAVLTGAEVELS